MYLQRINAVINHVHENLHAGLSVEELAQIAGFSPFHFHRIFRAITGETLLGMVTRIRLGRAVVLLRSKPEISISEAAFASGFSSLSVFSRNFKKQFAINASSWDRQSPLKDSKNRQFPENIPRYTVEKLMDFEKENDFEVNLGTLPRQSLAYIRVHDSYSDFSRIKEAYYRLVAWFQARGGDLSETTLYGMTQDDPDVTPQKLCRFDWCLAIPENWRAEGEVGIREFSEQRIASIRCVGDASLETKIIQYLFLYWLPRSRFQPANLPGMEIYKRQPDEMGWETYDLDCAIPIVPL